MRNKNDQLDSQLLRRYLISEYRHLTSAKPIPKAVLRIQAWLRARAKIAQNKTTLQQALASVPDFNSTCQTLIKQLQQALAVLDRKILRHIDKAGFKHDYQRCLSIPGIGPLNAAALVALFHRGSFSHQDRWIAFIGLDVRMRESGHFRGKRKLTKQGDPEIRRLLFNAARAGANTQTWRPYYQRLIERGFSSTAAYVALARKIARLAFILLNKSCSFDPNRLNNTCLKT